MERISFGKGVVIRFRYGTARIRQRDGNEFEESWTYGSWIMIYRLRRRELRCSDL
jgi:hypothetical protein